MRTGRLRPGAPLPPVRRLADDLGVSPATVAAAYRTLRQRGLVETAGRHGTRIRPRPAVGSRQDRRLPVPPGARDVSTGEPDPRLLPPLADAIHRLAGGDDADAIRHVGYERAGPVPELMTLARQRLGADGVALDDAALTVVGGALDGIERVLAAHLAPGTRVAVEDPAWANLLDLLAVLGLEPVPVDVDDDGPTAAGLSRALAAGVRAVLVTSRAQNPTGAVVSRSRATALRRLLREHPDLLVIEDDHAAELSELPLAPLAGATGSWAFIRSVSKPFGPDLRLAVLAGDETTVARVHGRMRLGTGWVSTVLQRLVVGLWQDPAVADLVDHARQVYAERRTALIGALAERGVAATGRSGINVWVPVADETSALARLRDAGWVAAPGSMYRLASPPGMRITISSLDLADVPVLADAVAAATSEQPARYGA